jgi:pimeloyl-ACP methyl ester carboxylesterase
MIPRQGEMGSEWWSNTGQQEAMNAHLSALGLSPEVADDDAMLYFHDVPPQVRAEAFRRGEPEQSWTPMTQPWPLNAWPDVPTRVLIGREDRLFPADFQRRITRERIGIEADEIEGGHLVAVSPPGRPRRAPRGLPDRRVDPRMNVHCVVVDPAFVQQLEIQEHACRERGVLPEPRRPT